MNNKINFDFVSPEASIVSSEVDMVLIPGIDGDAGILPDHSPFMTTLRQGIVEVTFEQGNVKKYLVEGGFADITQDKMTILAETSLNLSDTDSKVLKSELDIINEKYANESDRIRFQYSYNREEDVLLGLEEFYKCAKFCTSEKPPKRVQKRNDNESSNYRQP